MLFSLEEDGLAQFKTKNELMDGKRMIHRVATLWLTA